MITYAYADALNVVDKVINRTVSDDIAAYLCNVATEKIWEKFDWRESLTPFNPFYLVPLMQDYGPPAAIIPSDFWGLRTAYWVRPSTMPPHREPLRVIRDLPVTHNRYLPHAISYEASSQVFRVFPRCPESISATDYIIDGTYKKRFPKVTADALQSLALPWDDMQLDHFVQALKWAAWDYAGDPRAGEIMLQAGGVRYTGQVARMYDAIDHMAMSEGINMGDPAIAPSESLANSASLYTGAILGFGL